MKNKRIFITTICIVISITQNAYSLSIFFGKNSELLYNKRNLIILIPFILTIIFTITTVVFFKSYFSNKIISLSFKNDKVWNLEELISHSRETFLKVQNAIECRDINLISAIISPKMKEVLANEINGLIERGEINYLNLLEFSTTEIIGCEDYFDNSKDNYTAYIEGYILDYTILESTNQIIKNPYKVDLDFSLTYHFIRNLNQWNLEDINYKVNSLKVIKTKNFIEI